MDLSKWTQRAKELLRPADGEPEHEPEAEAEGWLGRAKSLWAKARDAAESVGWQERVGTWVTAARSRLSDKEAPAGRRLDLLALLKLAGSNVQQTTDKAAVTIAGVYSRWTGREVTPGRVKRMALQVGVAALAAAVVGALLDGAGGSGQAPQSQARSDGGGGWGSSFEDQVSRFFADKGGLNIQTHTVDQDGCRLD